MKKLFFLTGLLLATTFISCLDNEDADVATDTVSQTEPVADDTGGETVQTPIKP